MLKAYRIHFDGEHCKTAGLMAGNSEMACWIIYQYFSKTIINFQWKSNEVYESDVLLTQFKMVKIKSRVSL